LRIIAFAALLVYPLTAFSMAAQVATSAGLVIRHVNVIDVKNEALLKDQDVVLAGDRIVSVEPALVTRINGPSVIINGGGKYLIPGLWDCHIHLSWTTSSALPLLTALGITEVRDLGGKLADLERWRAQIADGTLVGPHMMRVGPILNGKAFTPYQFVPGSAEATRGAIRLLTYLGMDEIKSIAACRVTGTLPRWTNPRSSISALSVTFRWRSPGGSLKRRPIHDRTYGNAF
jgi:hypothetical protein